MVRRKDIIERSSHTFAASQFDIRVPVIIKDLVFMADGGITCLDKEILRATVPGGSQLPFPTKLKFLELGVRDKVIATFAKATQPVVLDGPAIRRKDCLLNPR